MEQRLGAWGAIISLLLLAGCVTGVGPLSLSPGRYGDVEVEEGPKGWLKLSPLSCDSQSQDEAGRQQRFCTGQIDLNRDGAMETIAQLYVLNMPSVISSNPKPRRRYFRTRGTAFWLKNAGHMADGRTSPPLAMARPPSCGSASGTGGARIGSSLSLGVKAVSAIRPTDAIPPTGRCPR